jgi:F-type H+-transporting ATPase subunit gamma
MPSARDIRRRIKSVTSTAQITRAMQMVAASKMARAQEAALTTRPFAQLLYRIQRHATTHAGDFTHPLLEVRPVRKRAVILFGTDKPTPVESNARIQGRRHPGSERRIFEHQALRLRGAWR